jgi:hypothetical protein
VKFLVFGARVGFGIFVAAGLKTGGVRDGRFEDDVSDRRGTPSNRQEVRGFENVTTTPWHSLRN